MCLLQRRDQVGHELHRHHDARAHRRPDDVLVLRRRGSPSPTAACTSQKVSVKSNGVWATEQKLA